MDEERREENQDWKIEKLQFQQKVTSFLIVGVVIAMLINAVALFVHVMSSIHHYHN